eukprot:6195223-Pleurochrysis_carterae.AAC.9
MHATTRNTRSTICRCPELVIDNVATNCWQLVPVHTQGFQSAWPVLRATTGSPALLGECKVTYNAYEGNF